MDTTPRLGDSDNNLLFKIAQSLMDGAVSGITQAAADARYVALAGSTMTGALTIGVDGVDNANLAVDPDSASPVVLTRHVADNAPAILRVQKKGTTGNVDGAVSSNDNLARFDFYAWDGSAFAAGAVFQLVANQNWAAGTARGSRLSVNVVANGSITTTEMLRMTATQLDLRNGAVLASGGTQVVTGRQTGWTAATGTATRTTFATTTVTTELLAQRVKALIDDLISHGLIGA